MTRLRPYVFPAIFFFCCASAQQCNKTGAELSAGQENPFTFPCEAQQLVLLQQGLNPTSFDVSDCKLDGNFDLTLSKSRIGLIKLTFICHTVSGNDCSFYTINTQTLNDTIIQDSVDCGSGKIYSNNQPLPTTTDVLSLHNDPSITSSSNTLTNSPMESSSSVTSYSPIDSMPSAGNAMTSSSNDDPSAPESGSTAPGSSVDGGSPTMTSSGTGNPMPPATCACSSV